MAEPTHTPFDDLDAWAVLRPQDIADRLRVDVRSVRRAIASGALPASRACGLRVLASDAASWWKAGAVQPRALQSRTTPTPPALPDETIIGPPRRRRRFERQSGGVLPLPPRRVEG